MEPKDGSLPGSASTAHDLEPPALDELREQELDVPLAETGERDQARQTREHARAAVVGAVREVRHQLKPGALKTELAENFVNFLNAHFACVWIAYWRRR